MMGGGGWIWRGGVSASVYTLFLIKVQQWKRFPLFNIQTMVLLQLLWRNDGLFYEKY